MAKFIEVFDVEKNNPVAINVSSIMRVYAKTETTCGMVLSTLTTEFYEGVDDEEGDPRQPGASMSERVTVKGSYIEVMKKIIATGA